METIAQHYKIPTNLSIAAARLAEMMPRAGYVHREPAGEQGKEVRWVVTLTLDQRKQVEVVSLVMFTLDRQQEDEAVYLTLRPVSYLTTCGPWQVRVEPERMQWTHAGVCVTLGEGMDVAVAWGDTRQKRALWAVRARLPRLELPSGLWAWRIDCRVVAVTPNQVLIALWTFHLDDFVRSLEKQIKALWQLERMTSAQVNTLSGSVIPPHPLRERREKVLRLKREGKSVKEIAKETGENEHVIKADLRWLRQKGHM